METSSSERMEAATPPEPGPCGPERHQTEFRTGRAARSADRLGELLAAEVPPRVAGVLDRHLAAVRGRAAQLGADAPAAAGDGRAEVAGARVAAGQGVAQGDPDQPVRARVDRAPDDQRAVAQERDPACPQARLGSPGAHADDVAVDLLGAGVGELDDAALDAMQRGREPAVDADARAPDGHAEAHAPPVGDELESEHGAARGGANVDPD